MTKAQNLLRYSQTSERSCPEDPAHHIAGLDNCYANPCSMLETHTAYLSRFVQSGPILDHSHKNLNLIRMSLGEARHK